MKNRKIICIILMIFLTFFITKQAYAEQDNEINENVNINKMEIELTGVDGGKNWENKEAMVDVSINNANYVNGGTIQIKYDSDLTFVSAENKNENYSMEVVNNQDESILIIAFTSNEGQSGDIKLCSLKFRLPKTIKEEKYYNISFGESTNITTTQNLGSEYNLFPTTIHCEKSNKTMTIIKWILIIVGIVLIVVIIKNLIKNKKRG